MAEEKDLKQAQTVYKSLCNMLDERGWRYQKNEQELSIRCGAQGEDLPMEIIIEVDAERQLASLISPMPFEVPENRRAELAIAVTQANNGMVDGSFDYDFLSGRILFRMTSSFRQSLIGKAMFAYMLECSCYTIDEYNDKFLAVAKNNMSIHEIIDFIK